VSRDRPGSGGSRGPHSVPVSKPQDVTIPKPSSAPGKSSGINTVHNDI
jgi:hypothetical protein